ncbi:EexN family lipoprotein [Paraburkholderia acidipaludis]|uniref:EexN family lipoprotein n=1 Tax=Paraburkholderia acidipaludis TaxID=660537 RepID=UPI000A05C080|nr:EexN family lipoprotein [Paraburkholderia acidipaludis]
MNKIVFFVFALVLSACSKSAPIDTAESLASHPDHLREVEQQCASGDKKMPTAECNAASEARHRLFIGNGPKYTPPKDVPKF